MTHQEASKLLKERFPWKLIYIQCTIWTREDGQTEPPRYSVCVYKYFPHLKDGNINGTGSSLAEAVQSTIAASNPAAPEEADAIFERAIPCPK